MSSRRPPSQRNAEYAVQRHGRQLQSMSPGTAGGRLASAAPIRVTSDALATVAPGLDGNDSAVLFAYDTFALTGAAPTLTLSYVPVAGSLHVYLNGLEQLEGTDYSLNGLTLTVLAAMNTGTGDTLDARYAFTSGQEVVPTDAMGGSFFDDFNRADSTTTLGSPWVAMLADGTAGTVAWGITGGKAYQATNSTGFQEGFAYVDLGIADVDVSVTFSTLITTGPSLINSGGLLFRGASDTSFWLLSQSSLVFKAAGAGFSSPSVTFTPFAAGDIARVVAVGGTIKIYNGTTLLATVNDTRNQTATRHGLEGSYRAGSASATFDDFTLLSAS